MTHTKILVKIERNILKKMEELDSWREDFEASGESQDLELFSLKRNEYLKLSTQLEKIITNRLNVQGNEK
jgi:hypothetical protein